MGQSRAKKVDPSYLQHAEYQHYIESGFARSAPKPLPLGRIIKWAAIATAVVCGPPAFSYLLSVT